MDKKETGASRRALLKIASGTAPAAVAALAVSGTEAEAAETDTGARMAKTEHVKKYLASARF